MPPANETSCQEHSGRIRELEDRMTRLEVLVGADDKDTGLRGTVEKLSAQIAAMEKRMYMALGVISVVAQILPFLLERWFGK